MHIQKLIIRTFQVVNFRLDKFIEKFKTRVKNPKIEEIIAFDNFYTSCSSLFIFTSVKIYLLR